MVPHAAIGSIVVPSRTEKGCDMSRVKIRRNQLTLPDELRQVLSSADEDELEAELVEGGVLLRPSREARRRAALERIHRAQASVRLSPELAALSPEERERRIVELLEADEIDAAPHG